MGGSGRGMGMGQGVGQGMGMAGSAVPGSRPAGGTENIADLKKQAAELQRQLDAIQNKIKEM
jgi:hypothetical protein